MKSKSDVFTRILTTLIIGPFVVLCFVSYKSLVGLVATVVFFASYEYLTFSLKGRGHTIVRLVVNALIVLSTMFYGLVLEKIVSSGDNTKRPELVFLIIMIAISSIVIFSIKDPKKAKDFVVNGIFALFYVSMNLSFFFPIYLKFGASLALLTLVSVWAYDAGAYFTGMRFGRIKISPSYSPKKSLEGVIGGFVITFLFFLIYEAAREFLLPGEIFRLSAANSLILSAVVAFFGTVGDIVESSFKRYHNVKDSGSILPGHGGMLDRIDGLLFVVPMFYIFLILFS